MKCVFMCASLYGLQCFEAVSKAKEVEIVGVITPKERFELKYGAGFSKEMGNTIFHDLLSICQKEYIPLFIMEKMNCSDTIQKIKEWNPDLIIVSGWYHLIGRSILEIPSKGVIGLHSSLLPKYRGGAPLVWQMINGEEFAGITLFYMNEGVDAGDIICQCKIKIEDSDNIGTLYNKIGKEGIRLLIENIPLIASDCAPRIKQLELSDKDIYPQRNPEDGRVDWNKTSKQIYNFVRAQTRPYPGAFTHYKEYKVIIWSCAIVLYKHASKAPGSILDIESDNFANKPIIAANDSEYVIKVEEYDILDKNNHEIEMKENIFEIGKYFD
ncbi:MAG: methionyl-tRNA formyltransferase [Lachnospiraceae bacterium]|nr:methionyl-tRNA formyltransferase [Lachnospiraceae bacterium]